MLTLDTNVIVRRLVGDDPQQTPIAEQAFLDAIAAGGVYLPDVELAEVARVLWGHDLNRVTRHRRLERLVRTRGVAVDDIDAVINALENFRQGRGKSLCPGPELSPSVQNHSSRASSLLFTRALGVCRWKSSSIQRSCSPSAATARIG